MQTNADRLARGFTPLPPRRLYGHSEVVDSKSFRHHESPSGKTDANWLYILQVSKLVGPFDVMGPVEPTSVSAATRRLTTNHLHITVQVLGPRVTRTIRTVYG